MKSETVIEFADALPAVEDTDVFPGALTFKVSGKVFAILGESAPHTPVRLTMKCDPELAVHLRQRYAAVQPGYHVNKRHWNSVMLESTIPDAEVLEMLEHSYDRVVAGMPKSARHRLEVLRAAARG